MYPLMEKHTYARQMQAEMMQEIEGAQPTFVVVANLVYRSTTFNPQDPSPVWSLVPTPVN
jgi:hypothetical protein